MKKLITVLLLTVLLSVHSIAQDASPSMIVIHEDIVKPSMDATYRQTMGKLNDACNQNKTSFSWNSIAYDDNSYVHISPLKTFAELDKEPFAELETKIGKEAMTKLWADFDRCIESHRTFVVLPLPQFSYTIPSVGDNYREITFWYVEPGKDAEAEKIMAEWKTLYESKKAPNGFTVSKAIFGREPVYAFVSWGKNAVDLATKEQKTQELLGEEGGKMWAKTLAITQRYHSKRGWTLPEFSYNSASK